MTARKKILRGDVFEVNKSPFQSSLDKLKVDGQPTLGAKPGTTVPVTMVLFSAMLVAVTAGRGFGRALSRRRPRT